MFTKYKFFEKFKKVFKVNVPQQYFLSFALLRKKRLVKRFNYY